MRIPNTGQPLYERLIVREAKLVAERMLANYVDPPNNSVVGLCLQARDAVVRLAGAVRVALAQG